MSPTAKLLAELALIIFIMIWVPIIFIAYKIDQDQKDGGNEGFETTTNEEREKEK